jgi:uncharacterized membrane protein YcaP (DUF421 family)
MLFNDWHSVLRIIVISAATYVLVVGLLRVLGEEALAKMSAYDLLVTVALGSLLASIPFGSGVTVADGMAAIGTYLILQQVMRWAIKRSKRAERFVRDVPQIMVWDGQFIEHTMLKDSILKAEIRAAVRRAGLSSMSQALAVILENDGDWSVLPYDEKTDLSALEGLELPWPVPRGTTPQSRSGSRGLPVTTTSGTI